MGQIALPLSSSNPDDNEHLIVTICNRATVSQLDNARNWPFLSAIIVGPPSSGKTTLGQMFIQEQDGVFIDDADGQDENELFHAWNEAHQSSRPILFASRFLPEQWGVELADLQSRLAASQLLEFSAPDDAMQKALLQKLLAKKGIALSDKLTDFALVRLERSYSAISALAEEIDRLSLEQKRAVGRKLVGEAVAKIKMDQI